MIRRPEFLAEAAFATGPRSASPVWATLGDYAVAFSCRRGRQYERDRAEAATGSLLADNSQRVFDPSNTNSPFYGYLKPVRRLRLRALNAPSAGTPLTLSGSPTFNADFGCTIDGTDKVQAPTSLVNATQGWAAARVKPSWASGSPPTNPRVVDFGGDLALFYTGGNWRLEWGALPDVLSVPSVHNAGDLRTVIVSWTSAQLKLSIGGVAFATIARTQNPAGFADLNIGNRADAARPFTGDVYWFACGTGALTDTDAALLHGWLKNYTGSAKPGLLWMLHPTLGLSSDASPTMVWDCDDTATIVPAMIPVLDAHIERFPLEWEYPGYGKVQLPLVDGFEAMAQGDVAAGGVAVNFPQEQSGSRINRVLDAIGWPAARRNIDAGQSSVQAKTFQPGDGEKALAHALDIADSELGIFFLAANGDATFHDRHRRFKAPYITAVAVFGDGPGELPYDELIPSYDKDRIANDVRVTRLGGVTQVALDTTSQDDYYPRTLTRDVQLTTDAECSDQGLYILGRQKDAFQRFDQLKFRPLENDTLWMHALQREIGDRITIKQRPPGGGAVNSQECHIESIADEWNAEADEYSTTWQLSPADVNTYWILGDPVYGVLGSTTKLAY